MSGLFDGAGEILSALAAGDSWMLSEAMRNPAIWPMGLVAMLAAAVLILIVYRVSPWFERNFESTVMVVSYLAIGGIIFVEVFRRFVLSQQAPWSTTLPPFLFLIMTWFGCSYNVKLRTHLAFAEFRTAMPRTSRPALAFFAWKAASTRRTEVASAGVRACRQARISSCTHEYSSAYRACPAAPFHALRSTSP